MFFIIAPKDEFYLPQKSLNFVYIQATQSSHFDEIFHRKFKNPKDVNNNLQTSNMSKYRKVYLVVPQTGQVSGDLDDVDGQTALSDVALWVLAEFFLLVTSSRCCRKLIFRSKGSRYLYYWSSTVHAINDLHAFR